MFDGLDEVLNLHAAADKAFDQRRPGDARAPLCEACRLLWKLLWVAAVDPDERLWPTVKDQDDRPRGTEPANAGELAERDNLVKALRGAHWRDPPGRPDKKI